MLKGKNIFKIFAWLLSLAIAFFALDLVFPIDAQVQYTPVILAADNSVMHTFLTHDEQWRFRLQAHEITPELQKAILFKEDKYFWQHPGVNVLAIGRAVVSNLSHLKRTSGASTITMQVARMLHPENRTYIHKMLEMFRALQLELHYTKREILIMYLNLVPYGGNIQGVKAASIMYFNKMPAQLSLAEITALSIIPNRPNSMVLGRNNAAIITQRNRWLTRFGAASLFPATVITDAIAEPLTAYRHNAPSVAPQLAYRLRRQYPGVSEIHTTIDTKVQQIAADLTSNYTQALKLANIHNAAVLIINNRTHAVSAYIGSSDFSDKAHQGEVDGIVAMRSPGSTLKPLLYAMCMDLGYITPKTIIADVPVNFQGYSPENYDLQFRGNLTIEDALRYSLNIPAVKLLNRAGVHAFTHKLTEAGFTSIANNRRKNGLSMILGGCGVRLEELTGLYASFANQGTYHPPIYVADSSNSYVKGNTPLLSAAASEMVTGILKQLHRPDLPNLSDNTRDIPRIAWKTGTSYGRKDAWSIGYNERYTIGVWLGNFNGTGVAGLNGAGTATPLLFQLFNAIDPRAGENWLDSAGNVSLRQVCSKSGMPPNDRCTELVLDYYIPGVSENTLCNHEIPVWVSPDESLSYCTTCLPTNGYKTTYYPNIPPDVAGYYEGTHIKYIKVPPHNPMCSRVLDGVAPVITSLTHKLTYIILDKNSGKLQLACTAGNDVKQVYWYINDRFFASSGAAERLFFIPETNHVKISCSDDKGRN